MGGANAHRASAVLIHPPYIVNLFLSRGLDLGEDSSLINPQETGPAKYQQAAIPRRAGSFEGVGDAAGDFRCYPPLPIPVAEEMVLCNPDATLPIYIAEVARTFLSGWLGQFLKAAAAGLGRIELCPGHGTYTPGQVVLDGSRTVVIDWDTYEMADPCRDVARFVVEIKRNAWKHLGSLHAYDREAGIFVKTYFAAAHAAITPNLAFHEAAICLERAKHDRDKQVQGWQQKAEIMLDEGVRILSGESIESATATDTTQVVLVPRFGNGVAAAVNKTALILGLVAEALLDLSGA